MDLKNKDLQLFLIGKLPNKFLSDEFKLCESNLSITPTLVQSIFKSWKLDTPELAGLKELKDLNHRQKLLTFLMHLDSFIDEKIITTTEAHYFFEECYQKSATLKEAEKLSETLVVALNFKLKADVLSLGKLDSDSLIDLLQAPLIYSNLLDYENREGFFKNALQSRAASSILTYAKNINNGLYDLAVESAFRRFLNQIAEGSYLEKRHEANSYKDLLSEESRQKWEEGATNTVIIQNSPYFMIDSEDWKDLFMIGQETGGCQLISGDPKYNKCLLGYVLNGKSRVLCIKESKDGPMIARAIIKIMTLNGKPVLHLKKNYNSGKLDDETCSQMILEFAKQRAQNLGLELYKSNIGGALVELA